jgi:D-3-phosphoglycerate dehydrogenase
MLLKSSFINTVTRKPIILATSSTSTHKVLTACSGSFMQKKFSTAQTGSSDSTTATPTNTTTTTTPPNAQQQLLDEIASLEKLLRAAKGRLAPLQNKPTETEASTNKFIIGTYNNISREGLDKFGLDKYKVLALEKNPKVEPHAILVRSHQLKVEQVPVSVRAVARCGAGTNNIPVDKMTERGIPVFNSPGANSNAVKELTVCALLLASRGVMEGIEHTKKIFAEDGKDKEKVKKRIESDKKNFVGQELAGKRLGVIGLGFIGASVAESALHFGMEVVGYDPGLSVETAWKLPGHKMERASTLMSLLDSADYVTLHAPYSKSTHHLIGRAELKAMKKEAHLINFARGELVDTSALRALYDAGERTGRYISDFPDEFTMSSPFCTSMPHLGASTEEAESKSAAMAAQQVIDFIETGTIINSVNYPTTKLDRPPQAGARLCIVNKNVPGMLGQITTVVGEAKLNIIQQINTSRDSIAYNVVDLGTMPSDAEIDKLQNNLKKIPGVISSRLIEAPPVQIQPRYYVVQGGA